MDGEKFTAESVSPPFKYYKKDRIFLDGKYYKLIWLLEKGQIYIGVINAYQR